MQIDLSSADIDLLGQLVRECASHWPMCLFLGNCVGMAFYITRVGVSLCTAGKSTAANRLIELDLQFKFVPNCIMDWRVYCDGCVAFVLSFGLIVVLLALGNVTNYVFLGAVCLYEPPVWSSYRE